jgi:ABC-type antimicrobial peptide transport system permease subunit
LGHTLVTSVNRRRRDLAVMKTIGFVRRQVSATVAWQALTVALVALVLGIPIGVAGGRWVWTTFAEQLGVPFDPRVPLVPVLIAIPATILVANVIAALPARSAARTRPALVLRSE